MWGVAWSGIFTSQSHEDWLGILDGSSCLLKPRLLTLTMALIASAGCNFFSSVPVGSAGTEGVQDSSLDLGPSVTDSAIVSDDGSPDLSSPPFDVSGADGEVPDVAAPDVNLDVDLDHFADMGADAALDVGTDADDPFLEGGCVDYVGWSPIAYWSFDSPGPMGAYPRILGQNDVGPLEPIGAPTVQTGVSNFGVEFDGVNDALLIEHTQSLELSEGTVSLWFRMDNPSTPDYLSPFSKDASDLGDGGHFQILVELSILRVRLQDDTATHIVEFADVQADTWYHVLVTFGSAGLRLYVDGASVASNSHTGGWHDPANSLDNHEPLVVGASTGISDPDVHTPLTGYFGGAVDEVVILDYQLTETEAAQFYQLCTP